MALSRKSLELWSNPLVSSEFSSITPSISSSLIPKL